MHVHLKITFDLNSTQNNQGDLIKMIIKDEQLLLHIEKIRKRNNKTLAQK